MESSRTYIEENELLFENTLLRSELETKTCFMARLNSCRGLFPTVPAPVVTGILASKEVASLARNGSPVWISNTRLNVDEYYSSCFPWYAKHVPRFVHEASKASALISVDASLLVENIMNPVQYQKIFPSIVGEVSCAAPHLKCQLINVDFMLQICPLIQTRNVKVIRYLRQVETATWVIADISTYFSSYAPHLRPEVMRFPSGYLIQRTSNGLSKITVLEHWVYREEGVMNPPCPSNPDTTFAMKWLNALQRHYSYCLTTIHSMGRHIQKFDPICQANLLNLSSMMVSNFCTGVCGITKQNWKLLGLFGSPGHNIRMLTRDIQSGGAPCNLVSVTGVATMQAKSESAFSLIYSTRKQDIWDYLKLTQDLQEVICIPRSPNPGNEVNVFNVEGHGLSEWRLIEAIYYDASDSNAIIVHGWIEASSFAAVINSGDFSSVKISLSGITIVPIMMSCGLEGCIVSAGYQVKVNQTMVTNSDERVVNSLQKLVNDTLKNVENALLVRSNRR